MKRIIPLLFITALIVSCNNQDNYEIPTDANGDVLLTTISTATTTGITVLDEQFTVSAYFPNAKSGDVMNVELLQLQVPSGGTTTQLLPLSGTQKTANVGTDQKATISYTRTEAKLSKVGDYVVVAFNGATDYAKQRVDMIAATTVSSPKVSGTVVDVARTSEVAYFNATVVPAAGTYSGTLVAKRKNGVKSAWQNITVSGTNPFLIPISGDDFAAGKDTMYYSFTSSLGSHSDEITKTVIVRDPYFFLKRAATLTVGGNDGENLLLNTAVKASDAKATIAVSSSLLLQGGSAWLAAGNTIQFVPTTAAMYAANNSNNAIAAFNAGTPTATADPIAGAGVYIFKIVNGTADKDVYYGMLQVTNVVPGVSATFNYRIGNLYAHLSVIK
jgi:hypothetical protein